MVNLRPAWAIRGSVSRKMLKKEGGADQGASKVIQQVKVLVTKPAITHVVGSQN